MGLRIRNFPGFAEGMAPPDQRSIYEWARENVTLPASYSISGKFDVGLSRPMIAVFDAIKNDSIRRVRFRKPPRFGGSLIADISILWIILNDPGPIMWNWQSDEQARGHMKEKVWPLWRSCDQFEALVSGLGKHDLTTMEVYFGNFFFLCQGANLNSLQGKGIRWLFNDEVWLPVWQDLYQHAVYRTRDYERSGHYKIVDVSQAGNKGDVEDRGFREGNQCLWGYKATNGKTVPLLLGGKREDASRWGLVWSEDAKRKDGSYNKARAIETCRYVCKETGQEWGDSPATIDYWNKEGVYIPFNQENSPECVSFGTNGLLNRSFASIVSEKIDALELMSRGDMSAMRDFKQKTECIPWEEQHLTVTLTEARSGYLSKDYEEGQIWEGETHRCMTIDRQHGLKGDVPHRWVEIRAWRQGGESRQLFFGRVNTKESCRELQIQYKVKDRCVWQDAQFEKHEVFKECATFGWTAVFGSDTQNWPHYVAHPGQRDPIKVVLPYSPIQLAEVPGTNLKVAFLTFCEEYFADILANLVAGRGVAFERPDDGSEEYAKHLQAEHKIEKRPGIFKWEKLHSTKPNHGWDTSKMGVCFACVVKLLSLPKPVSNPGE